jgi:hypothetical protein
VPTRSCIDLTGRIAYSGVPALAKQGSPPDAVYAAILSATKAAYALAIADVETSPNRPHVFFPAVVVDAQLFSCSLADVGDHIDVVPIPSAIPLR